MVGCPDCGRPNDDEARFCSSCGLRLGTTPNVEERKLVTVLFADVTGSTELADRLDAEELRDVMGAWFAAARDEVEAQGGVVEKYIGDAVMAVFGVPTSHEDDPARSLRAALGLRRALADLNQQLAATHDVQLEVRIGVNTGEAVATLGPKPGEPMVTGVAVNTAARLEQLAEPGQTVVAERTARAATSFRFQNLGQRSLRGKEEPVTAYLLLTEDANQPTRGVPGLRSPFVGRGRELGLLVALYERVAAERRPALVTIYGDPGVGKSRLVREFLNGLGSRPDPPRTASGRCLPYGRGIAYWPLAEVLKDLAGLNDDDPAEAVGAAVAGLVSDLFPDDGSPDLAAAALVFTLGLDAGSTAFARLQPSAVRAELHRAWRMLDSTVAAHEPLVIVVEDVHWADPVLLDLLEEVAERAQGAVLIVCPARPDLAADRATWGGGRRNFSAVWLDPLPGPSARELVSQILDVDGLPEEARLRILDKAEGNPFFLEEIVRQLIDTGQIVRAGDRWRAVNDLPHLVLPDTVQAVLAARIDLLEPVGQTDSAVGLRGRAHILAGRGRRPLEP